MGFVEMDNDKNMRATSKALELCNKSFHRAGLFGTTEVIFKQIKKSTNCDSIETIQYFSEDEMHHAYKKYRDMLKQ